MHRCFNVQEIFHLILTHILDPKKGGSHYQYPTREIRPGYSQEDLAAVSSLAQTCKTFCDPSLDVLWYYQTDLKPLLKCLPRHALKSTKPEHREDQLTLGSSIDRKDFERVDFYARRIHVLGDPDPDFVMTPFQSRSRGIDTMLYPLILSKRSVWGLGPLLPQLTCLSVDMQEFCTLAWYPRLVAGPQLKSIKVLAYTDDIEMGEYEPCWDNVLSVLSPALPTLKSLSLTFYDPVLHSQAGDIYEVDMPRNTGAWTLPQNILSTTFLDIISIPIDIEAISRIASIPTITVLRLTVSAWNTTRQDPALENVHEFPKLVDLWLRTDNQSICPLLIRRIGPCNLKTLQVINALGPGDDWDIDDILRRLKSAKFRDGLRHLEIIRANYSLAHNPDVQPISAATVNFLSPFKDLNYISLYQNGEVLLNRQDLDRISRQWPKLKVFDLRTRTRRGNSPHITLDDMLAFTSSLPDLEEIRLQFDAREDIVFATSSIPLSGVANQTLKLLDVCTSPLRRKQGAKVAELLGAAFPSLGTFEYGWDYPNQFGEILETELTRAEEISLKEWKEVASVLEKARVWAL